MNLSAEVQSELDTVVRQSSVGVARVRRAKILVMADEIQISHFHVMLRKLAPTPRPRFNDVQTS